MTDYDNSVPMPEVVEFTSEGVKGKAFVVFDMRGLNIKPCTINFEGIPTVDVEYLPTGCRVSINNGAVWFDTSEQSAAEIEYLFKKGKAPK